MLGHMPYEEDSDDGGEGAEREDALGHLDAALERLLAQRAGADIHRLGGERTQSRAREDNPQWQ